MISKFIHSNKFKVNLSFLSTLLFIYIVLFEFILPVNKFLPKPSMLFDSFNSLLSDYNFINGFIFTFTAIYIVMLISYLFIYIGRNILIYTAQNFEGLSELFSIGKYFIPLFLVLLFELWFGNSIWGEYLFILILTMALLKAKVISGIQTVKEEYIISAIGLGLNQNEINSKIIWKSLQPKVFDVMIKYHIYFWVNVLVYEFICSTQGIGSIFKMILKYNDLSALIVLLVTVIITLLIMDFILYRIKKKFFFWN